jgi:ADP-ribose pyrophosphatase
MDGSRHILKPGDDSMKKKIFPKTQQDLENLAPPWKRGEARDICDARIFTLQSIPSNSPETGKAFEFFRLRARDWVNVIALTPDNDMIFVIQQRHGIDRATLEIPAGIVEPGEAHVAAARRELEEETGFIPGAMMHLGTAYSNPAFMDNLCYSFLASDCTPTGITRRDSAEEIKVVTVHSSEIDFLLASGMLGNSMGLVAFLWYDLYRRGKNWRGDRNMGTGPFVPGVLGK